ncbi:LysR family transcriptional regulator [Bordetella petrii]|uniref:LysR family transcriptional regulator n=1 Tax=Bordetella petrii TaxID=94624 RepID=UPI001A96446D|nr:LysR family transcriptional regulator [Bordetella petrii]MBO1113484.1 LysR family transcriptional regulator [Bordetella petrii]
MLSSDDLLFFLALASANSLADAARKLDVTPSAVTQRLIGLERRLGIGLVDRSGRRMALTDEGELLAERARGICADLGGLADALASRRGQVAGHLRVLAPLGFGQRYVAPAIARFRRQCPEVTATLTLSDRPGSLAAHTWDVLVHIGELRDSALVMHRLAPNRRVLCAAPSYLKRRGAPAHPDALHDHDCIALRENDEDVTLWRLRHHDGATATVRIDPVLACNDGGAARHWALAGMGILVRSEWDVADLLRQGRLVELLPGWRLPDADIVALVASRKARSARTEHFLQHLHELGGRAPWMQAAS